MKGLRAFFSVEAAWVFGISMIVIYLMLALSFQLYAGARDAIAKTQPPEWDAAKSFRLEQMGEDFMETD